MQCHGFRKFFDTTCTLNVMDGLYVEKLMGHNIGIKAHYFKPSAQDLLEGNDHKLRYLSVIDTLTINDESRLKRQNEILKVKKSEFEYLKQQVEETKRAQAKFTTDYMAFLKSKLEIPQDVNKIELTFDPEVHDLDKELGF